MTTEVVSDPKASNELSTQDKPKPIADEVKVPQSYVWLADGSVLRVANEDIPQPGHMTLGHWQRGDKVYEIVGVYPIEENGQTNE